MVLYPKTVSFQFSLTWPHAPKGEGGWPTPIFRASVETKAQVAWVTCLWSQHGLLPEKDDISLPCTPTTGHDSWQAHLLACGRAFWVKTGLGSIWTPSVFHYPETRLACLLGLSLPPQRGQAGQSQGTVCEGPHSSWELSTSSNHVWMTLLPYSTRRGILTKLSIPSPLPKFKIKKREVGLKCKFPIVLNLLWSTVPF